MNSFLGGILLHKVPECNKKQTLNKDQFKTQNYFSLVKKTPKLSLIRVKIVIVLWKRINSTLKKWNQIFPLLPQPQIGHFCPHI